MPYDAPESARRDTMLCNWRRWQEFMRESSCGQWTVSDLSALLMLHGFGEEQARVWMAHVDTFARLRRPPCVTLLMACDCIRVRRLHRFSGITARRNKHNLFWSVTLTRTEALLRHALARQGEATPTIPTLATLLDRLVAAPGRPPSRRGSRTENICVTKSPTAPSGQLTWFRKGSTQL